MVDGLVVAVRRFHLRQPRTYLLRVRRIGRHHDQDTLYDALLQFEAIGRRVVVLQHGAVHNRLGHLALHQLLLVRVDIERAPVVVHQLLYLRIAAVVEQASAHRLTVHQSLLRPLADILLRYAHAVLAVQT